MILLVVILVVLGLWGVATYNGIAQLGVRADGAWSDIDVQLKRRHDLIPNLVETVKGYAAHERQVFQQVTEARSRAMQATGPDAKSAAEGQLTASLKSLFAVAENYPELRANQNFLGLQQSLEQIEEAVQSARRYYNAVVRDYNTKLTVLPDRLVGQLGGFKPRAFFQLDAPDERTTPRVSFS